MYEEGEEKGEGEKRRTTSTSTAPSSKASLSSFKDPSCQENQNAYQIFIHFSFFFISFKGSTRPFDYLIRGEA